MIQGIVNVDEYVRSSKNLRRRSMSGIEDEFVRV
jgi:hypothetical protein